MTFDEIRQNEAVKTYISQADASWVPWALQSIALPTLAE